VGSKGVEKAGGGGCGGNALLKIAGKANPGSRPVSGSRGHAGSGGFEESGHGSPALGCAEENGEGAVLVEELAPGLRENWALRYDVFDRLEGGTAPQPSPLRYLSLNLLLIKYYLRRSTSPLEL
jgi:hypothetical protein